MTAEEDTTVPVDEDQLHDLIYQALETELGGVQVYESALGCTRDDRLRREWGHYLEQTRHHVELVEEAMRAFGLAPGTDTPGRRVVRHTGEALVKTIALARAEAIPEQAEVVAAECVTLAETKDHLNRRGGQAPERRARQGAAGRPQGGREQEDEHLYHTTGWALELWIEGLGLPAVLPPPEEQKEVKTAIGAARAKQARGDMT
jgi:hypothetical protein